MAERRVLKHTLPGYGAHGPRGATSCLMSKTALITGASVGIGYELAKQFARGGYDLLLVARTEEKLKAVAAEVAALGVRAHYILSDLADPAAPRALFADVTNRGIAVDALVNNAGF